MRTDPELLNERLGRLATILDEMMPKCALLVRDALDFLKEQEPRVAVLDEIKEGEPYWFSTVKGFVTKPVICVHREDDAQKPYITFVWQFGTFSFESEDYEKTWCCWTARPTDGQRKAAELDET